MEIHLNQAGVANGSIVETHEPFHRPVNEENLPLYSEQWTKSLPADGVSDSLACSAFHGAQRCVSIDQCEASKAKRTKPHLKTMN